MNFFLSKAEGKSNVRALGETGVGIFTGVVLNKTPLSKYRDECSKLLNDAIKKAKESE
ncbi:hypothetical protein OLQ17_00925 [Campylobacter jejuni]|nr:hypothetical protein [Campylobacter jejuni]